MQRLFPSGFSAMTVSAALSLVLLVGAAGWKIDETLHPPKPQLNVAASAAASDGTGDAGGALAALENDASSSDPIAQLTPQVVQTLASDYFAMQQSGTYSSSSAATVAQNLASNVQVQLTYTGYSADEIPTDPGTSYARMLQYRANLQNSLQPLLNNNEYELSIFAQYVQTKDPQYLTQLQAAAQNYALAASSSAQIVVPQDAVQVQLGILNAMQEFATVLNAMAAHAQDPIASTVLLENYNQAESDMETAFNALATYEKSKHA